MAGARSASEPEDDGCTSNSRRASLLLLAGRAGLRLKIPALAPGERAEWWIETRAPTSGFYTVCAGVEEGGKVREEERKARHVKAQGVLVKIMELSVIAYFLSFRSDSRASINRLFFLCGSFLGPLVCVS